LPDLHDVTILIPSLQPDHLLTDYVHALRESGYRRIVVVDDGSGEPYQEIFNRIAVLPGCSVVTHPVNRGKGEALKSGLKLIQLDRDCVGVVTADSDGQHSVADVDKMAQALAISQDTLYLGSRDFSLPIVPSKSRAGNRITSFVFAALYGRWLPDTQTGLRAFGASLVPMMMAVPGSRYEYEMNVLIQCAGRAVAMMVIPIETIYHNDNKGSHFRPFRDSARIYKLLFSSFFKFASASALSTILDIGMFTLFDKWLVPALLSSEPPAIIPWISTTVLIASYLARLISAGVNYKINKRFVFDIKKCKDAFPRYIILCVAIITASSLGVSLLHDAIGLDNSLAKPIVDGLLFFINYRIQRTWVFSLRNKTGKDAV
jgi:putative flippase GtrA